MTYLHESKVTELGFEPATRESVLRRALRLRYTTERPTKIQLISIVLGHLVETLSAEQSRQDTFDVFFTVKGTGCSYRGGNYQSGQYICFFSF